ncbi:uncharacterized protein LOC106673869 isoform X2 [Cimex lectularius]|nr:uncharacterized protein LOC106673869 isoform X2 [Cimex lectularius]XP_014261751.1 uncharacterized protein LOC106673869 isoform X2 [Cimex lectularius]
MYTKDLGQGYFPTAKINKITVDQSDGDSIQSNSRNQPKPYNEWKSTNHHLFSQSNPNESDGGAMVSSLGQNLQQMNSYIPQGFREKKQVNPPITKNYHSPQMYYSTEQRKPRHESPVCAGANKYHLDDWSLPRNQRLMEQDMVPSSSPENPEMIGHYRKARLEVQKNRHLSPYNNYDNNPLYNYNNEVQYDPEFNPKCMFRENGNFFSKPNRPEYNQTHQFIQHDYTPNRYNSPYGNFNSSNPPGYLNKSCPCDSSHSKLKQKEMRKAEKLKNKQISDLYRIVWLQNEQLAMLQNQVRKLVEMAVKNDKTDTEQNLMQKREQEAHMNKKYIKGTKETRTFNLSVIEENQNITEKVSVGIMTSFIENGVGRIMENDKNKMSKTITPKSESSSLSSSCDSLSEETEEEKVLPILKPPKKIKSQQNKKGNKRDESFTLNGVEIPTVVDNVPSPQTSFHLDMQDYRSTSTSDSAESSSEESGSDEELKGTQQVGWTFYDNVVGKVNNMLKKADDLEEEEDSENEIRNTTMEQLKRLGISFVESENTNPKKVTFGQGGFKEPLLQHKLRADCDTSMRMNALATKYLTGKLERVKDAALTGQTNTNLSFATMRYLERYHLVPQEKTPKDECNGNKKTKTKKNKLDKKKVKNLHNAKSGKILDITAIKQQPKLLPKKL